MRLRGFVFLFLVASTAVAGPRPIDSSALPRVLSAVGSRSDGSAGLGDRLTVRVSNVADLLATTGGCNGVVLFLSDMAVPDLPPETCDSRTGAIRFLLDRKPEDDANNRAWRVLLGYPHASLRRVSVSVGTLKLIAIPTNVRAFPLFVIPRFRLVLFFVFLVAFLALALVLSRRTSLIRRAGASAKAPLAPYSFSKSQQLFWSVLVIATFVFLWMMTGEVDTLTGSVLALLGITAGTGVTAWMIDTSRDAGNASSRGFIADILSEGGGIAIHRVQAAVWTLLLGVIFCETVYRTLFMPQFSFTLVGLMGITTGTYAAFKLAARTPPSGTREVLPVPGRSSPS